MKLQQLFSCPMKWESMFSLDESTKYCQLCSKKIHDFEKASDAEIQEVLEGDSSVCAQVPVSKLSSWITPFQKALAAIVLCFAGTLFTVEFAHGQRIEVVKNTTEQTKKIQGRIIDNVTSRPVFNAKITYRLDQKEYEVHTNIMGHFEIEFPQKYIALNLNIYYNDELKIEHFEEELFANSNDAGDIIVELLDEQQAANIKWLSGTVVTEEEKETMPSVNVWFPELNSGTVTDIDGSFRYPVWEDIDSLTIRTSFVGFEEKEVRVSIQEEMNEVEIEIEMEEGGMLLGVVIMEDHIDLNSDPEEKEGLHRTGQTWILNRRDY